MRGLGLAAAVALACLATSSAASQDASPSLAAVESQPLPLEQVIPRGVEIFERDRAAWVATDAMLASGVDPVARGVLGWVTEPADEGWKVTFVSARGDALAPAFEAWTSGRNVVRSAWTADDAAPLPAALSRAFRARQTAAATADFICSGPANSVVIPIGEPSRPDAFDVYILSATTDPAVVIAGGHTRFRVSGDGERVLDRRAFTNGCLTVPRAPDAVSFLVSHLRADTPEEIHVFLSLSLNLVVGVVTPSNGKVWMVEGDQIREVEQPAGEP